MTSLMLQERRMVMKRVEGTESGSTPTPGKEKGKKKTDLEKGGGAGSRGGLRRTGAQTGTDRASAPGVRTPAERWQEPRGRKASDIRGRGSVSPGERQSLTGHPREHRLAEHLGDTCGQAAPAPACRAPAATAAGAAPTAFLPAAVATGPSVHTCPVSSLRTVLDKLCEQAGLPRRQEEPCPSCLPSLQWSGGPPCWRHSM